MGCELLMRVKISAGTGFKIFVKPLIPVSGWIEVEKVSSTLSPNAFYMYSISSESIWVYANDDVGLTDVKIVFQ